MDLRKTLLFGVLVAAPSVILFSSAALLVSPIDWLTAFYQRRHGQWRYFGTTVKVAWADWMLWIYGVKVVLVGPGAGSIKSVKGSVFVANHQSALDVIVVCKILSNDASFVSKKELRRIPIFGWAAQAVGVVFIDRSRGTNNKSLNEVTARLAKGLSIIIFPEGTRSVDGALLPFKRGAFVMAIDAGAPIVPLAVLDSRFLLPKHRLTIDPGTIHVWVGEPINTQGLNSEDRFEVSDKIRGIIAKQLENSDKNRKNT